MIMSDFAPKTRGLQPAAGVSRMVKNREKTELHARRLFANVLANVHVIGGRRVFALLPSRPINKERAMEGVLEASGASGVLYVEDDIADEDVFRRAGKDFLRIRAKQAANTATTHYLSHCLEMLPLPDELLGRQSELSSEAGVGLQ